MQELCQFKTLESIEVNKEKDDVLEELTAIESLST